MLLFKLPAVHSVRVSAARRRDLHNIVLLGRAEIFGHEENNDFQERPRAGCPCGEGGVGREEPTGHLHACLDGGWSRRSVISSSGEVEDWMRTTSSVVVCLAVAVLTLADAFFYVFPVAGLVAA
jgi:hypothetical protein